MQLILFRLGRYGNEWVYGVGIIECSMLDMLTLRCLLGFHGFRNVKLSKERFVLEMVVKAIRLHRRMSDKEKLKFRHYSG